MAVIEQKMTDLTEIQSPDDVQSFIIHDGTGMKLAPKDLILSGGSGSGGGSALDVAPNSGAHNSIFRGQNLGTTVTEAQWNSIDAGTFDDLFIGDYWEINSVRWRIAAFDYYLRTGNTEVTKHHVTIVPDQTLGTAKMESSNTTQNGYGKSAMFTTNLATAKTTVNNAFDSAHVLSFKAYFSNASSNGLTSGASWYDSTVDIMSELNVYGRNHFVARSNGSTVVQLYTTDKTQYPLFKLAPELIVAVNSSGSRTDYWLRDIVTSAYCARVGSNGLAGYDPANNASGVRPRFNIIKS